MKSQLVVRKYMQGLAIPSVLQHVFKICISHKTIPKSVLNINSSRPPPKKKEKKPSTWLATRWSIYMFSANNKTSSQYVGSRGLIWLVRLYSLWTTKHVHSMWAAIRRFLSLLTINTEYGQPQSDSQSGLNTSTINFHKQIWKITVFTSEPMLLASIRMPFLFAMGCKRTLCFRMSIMHNNKIIPCNSRVCCIIP